MDDQMREDEERLKHLPEHERRRDTDHGGSVDQGGGTIGEPVPAEIRPIDDQPLPDEPAVDEGTVPPVTRSG
jgi:hypothetical protein